MRWLAKGRFFLLCQFFLCYTISIVHAGFVAGTLVKMPDHFATIENLSVGDHVESFNVREYVSHVITYKKSSVEKAFCIVLADETIITSQDQKFYLAPARDWEKAKNLKPGDLLFCSKENSVKVIDIYELEQEVVLFDITVEQTHTFFVSKHSILVHNFVPIAIGFTWAFGGGAIEFVGTSIACGILGLLGLKFYKNKNESARTEIYIGDVSNTTHFNNEKERDNGA